MTDDEKAYIDGKRIQFSPATNKIREIIAKHFLSGSLKELEYKDFS